MIERLRNEPSIRRLQHKEICNHYYPKLMLISYVAAFWGYTHGATKYMLLGLVITTWMLIKIRLEEE
jgi:hypothetical protein